MGRLHGYGLGNATADVVTDEACAVDAEQVEQDEESISVRFNVEREVAGWIGSAVAQEIDDDHASSFREEWDQILPEMRRGREAVDENQGLAAAARAGGEVVEARAAHVEEFAAHLRR